MERVNLYTVKDIANYLNVHEITIYRLLKQKKIPAIRVGGQWRFDLDSVRAGLNIKEDTNLKKPLSKKTAKKGMPKFLWKYFWDTDPKKVSLLENREFVLGRILEYGDIEALEWIKKNFSIEEIKGVVMTSKELSAKSLNFWRLVLRLGGLHHV